MLHKLNVRFRWLLSYHIKTKIMNCKVRENKDLEVLHVSQNFIIVNKMFDIAINSNTPETQPVTIATMLNYRFPHLYDPAVQFGFRFCHRLDYSTSGVLCVALNKAAANKCQAIFQSRNAEKYYLALLHGHVLEDQLTMTSSIGADSRPEFSHCMCTSDKEYCVSPRVSVTKLLVLQKGTYNGKPATKVLLKLMTGRRHQIRVHCHELGHTIVGDFTYSNRQDVIPYRMFLHAFKLFVPMKSEEIDIMTDDPFSENYPENNWFPRDTVNQLDAQVFSKFN